MSRVYKCSFCGLPKKGHQCLKDNFDGPYENQTLPKQISPPFVELSDAMRHCVTMFGGGVVFDDNIDAFYVCEMAYTEQQPKMTAWIHLNAPSSKMIKKQKTSDASQPNTPGASAPQPNTAQIPQAASAAIAQITSAAAAAPAIALPIAPPNLPPILPQPVPVFSIPSGQLDLKKLSATRPTFTFMFEDGAVNLSDITATPFYQISNSWVHMSPVVNTELSIAFWNFIEGKTSDPYVCSIMNVSYLFDFSNMVQVRMIC